MCGRSLYVNVSMYDNYNNSHKSFLLFQNIDCMDKAKLKIAMKLQFH